ncbi:hypothetical protein J6590_071248 [Homalodisca vitripennis]|nr:hypothetical protein J6590_071248 [Homalodisca vitripennis]
MCLIIFKPWNDVEITVTKFTVFNEPRVAALSSRLPQLLPDIKALTGSAVIKSPWEALCGLLIKPSSRSLTELFCSFNRALYCLPSVARTHCVFLRKGN